MTGSLTFSRLFRWLLPISGKGRKGSLSGLLTKVVSLFITLEPSIKCS